MGLVMADLEGLDPAGQEYADRKAWIDRTKSNDVWAKKIFNRVGILLTSHQANRPYIKACLSSLKDLGLWITVAYDNFNDPINPDEDYDRFMPTKDIMNMIDEFILPSPYQTWGGVLYPYFWQLRAGALAMSKFEYVYCCNSDMILEKPEGFWDLFKLVDGHDIMTNGPDGKRFANTNAFFVRGKAFVDIVQHIEDHFIPWDVYEKYTQEIGNAEGRFGAAIDDLKLDRIICSPPKDDMCKQYPCGGTWWDMVGFRHIHAEHNYTQRNKLLPPPLKYFDKRFMGDEYRYMEEYEATKDIKVLDNWWTK